MSSEAGMSEEKAQRAMIDAARLADEVNDKLNNILIIAFYASSAWNKIVHNSWRERRSFWKPRLRICRLVSTRLRLRLSREAKRR